MKRKQYEEKQCNSREKHISVKSSEKKVSVKRRKKVIPIKRRKKVIPIKRCKKHLQSAVKYIQGCAKVRNKIIIF